MKTFNRYLFEARFSMLNQNLAREIWMLAKKQANLSKEDGVIYFNHASQEYRVDFEWWGPGCVYRSGNPDKFADKFDSMDNNERENLFIKELRRRLKLLGWESNLIGYGYEHDVSPPQFNDYCSIGYIVRLKTEGI